MNNVKLRIALYVSFAWLIEASPFLLKIHPNKFALDKFIKCRNGTRCFDLPTIEEPTFDFVGLVNKHGYPAEEHCVTTSDGYILRIHRIPRSPSQSIKKGKPIVFLQHGIFGSSDTWVIRGPDKDLAFLLADAGYDVWVGNSRGNTYSRSHKRLNPKDRAFWNFSFHEMGIYDMPAVIDYMLHKTNQKSIIYVGHSMGTTISYVLLSSKPEYNKKIKLVISFSPVALWHKPHKPFTEKFVIESGFFELLPLVRNSPSFGKKYCNEKSFLHSICLKFIFFVGGYNPEQFNATLVTSVFSYFPAGSSAKTLIHYSQHIASGEFTMYDYGDTKNQELYQHSRPHSYNLKNIISPVGLFYGKGDGLIASHNPIALSKRLPNLLTIEAVPDEKFTHLDFLFAQDAKDLLYNRIMKIINEFSPFKEFL